MATSRDRASTSHRTATALSIQACSRRSSRRSCRLGQGQSRKPIRVRPRGGATRMLGKLSWAAIPLDQPIPMAASCLVGLVLFGVIVLVLVKGWLPYLWREWITSVDHKRIGVMYVLLASVMLLRGFTDAIMMRSQ